MNFSSRAKLACLSFIQSSFSVSRSIPYKKNIYRWISDMAANISVIPRSSLMDRKVKICISGLEAGQPVTLHATVVGDVKEVFESHAHYIANKEGVVDISRDISCGGSYHGIEQMGFLWGMMQTPGQRKGLRLMKRDVTKPYIIELNCFDGHLKPDEGFVNSLAQHTLQPIASAALEKWYIGEGVQRIPVRVGRIRGTLFIPPGNGPFAGVIDLFGTAGGLNEHKASLLASHGFTVLSLAYFNFDDLPKFLPYCEMDYFEEAAEWLVKHPAVIPGGIGVMGVSKGAEIVLMMAVLRKDIIRAVVPISTSYIVSSVPFKVKGDLTGSHYDFSKCRASEDGSLILRDCVPVHGLDKLEPPVVIPVETIECPMLIICGEDDEDVSAFEMAQEVLARMNSHGKGSLCTVLSYPGTGHLIEPPYAPHCYASYHKTFQANFAWGGNAKDHSRAQEDSWGKIIEFFRKNLGKKLNSYL